MTIIKEVDSNLIFTVRKYDNNAVYTVDLNRVGYEETTTITLSNAYIYAGRALKFTTDLTSYAEASYNYVLKADGEQVDNGTFYLLNLNTNDNDVYL